MALKELSLIFKPLICVGAAIVLAAAPLSAMRPSEKAVEQVNALDLSIDDNINTPEVPEKSKAYVRGAMDQLRRHLLKDGLAAKSIRGGLVVEVTVPCSDLFAPCATTLKQSAAKILRPLTTIVRDADKYKVIVAVHADDTGDDVYADSITAGRANALDDLLWQLAERRETNVIPYGLGRDEPLVPNSSRANRDKNRRVEIYIVPYTEMLAAAKRKK